MEVMAVTEAVHLHPVTEEAEEAGVTVEWTADTTATRR